MIIRISKGEVKSENRKLSLFQAIYKGQYSEYRKLRIKNNVEYYWVELKGDLINRVIGFDVGKMPISKSDQLNIEFSADIIKDHEIQLIHFNDIYHLMNIKDFNLLQKIHFKYLNYWNECEFIETPKFPIFSYNSLDITDTIDKYSTSDEVITNSDLNGYEWDEYERIFDSLGRVYEVEYLNFGHPMGVVVPKRIERVLTTEEINEILKNHDIEI
ncbi:hypothetical protein [Brumimicrobium mesophilum]|uniref:hypothetical protein n=1 Tax=Brumimicrobium mesophilum TaxID=392717 RepID=UPI000D1419A7|nr:hypothetical protein [Brumimicrobium mesophilum]